MPLNKSQRDHKEDTWRPDELERSLQALEKEPGSQPKHRSREHRGAAKEQDGAARSDDASKDVRGERLRVRRPLDPNGTDHETSAAGSERRRRSGSVKEAGNPQSATEASADAERRHAGRRHGDVNGAPKAELDGDRHHRRSKTEGDREDDDEERRRRHEERRQERRKQREGEATEEGSHGRQREEDGRLREHDGGGRRRQQRDDGAEESGPHKEDGGDRRERRGGRSHGERSGGRTEEEEKPSALDGYDEEEEEERRRRREERRRRQQQQQREVEDGQHGTDAGGRSKRRSGGGDKDEMDEQQRHPDEQRRRRRPEVQPGEEESELELRMQRHRSDRGQREEEKDGEAKERRRRRTDGESRDEEKEHRRRPAADDKVQPERHKRPTRGEKENIGDSPERRREKRDGLPREERDDRRNEEYHREERRGEERHREERHREERRGEERRGEERHREERRGEERLKSERKDEEPTRGEARRRETDKRRDERQNEESADDRHGKDRHRRAAEDGSSHRQQAAGGDGDVSGRKVKAAGIDGNREADAGDKANNQRRDRLPEQVSTKTGRQASDDRAKDEVFRSKSSRPQEATDAVEDEAIEVISMRNNKDGPVIRMGAASAEYDEDFEDYDEDFEEAEDDDTSKESTGGNEAGKKLKNMSNHEMEDLFEAMNRENDRLLAESRNSSSRESKPEDAEGKRGRSHARPATSKPRSFINFVSAKQREMNSQVSSRARKRGKELLQIIDLDTVHADLFEMAPVKEYELYMRSFGRTDARQVYVQTNADSIERDVQTEDIELSMKWTQHPADDAGRYCGDESSGDKENRRRDAADDGDGVLLLGFLQKTSRVVECLLEEERQQGEPRSGQLTASKLSFSEGLVRLGTESVDALQGREVTACCFSQSQPNMLLTAHSIPQMADVTQPSPYVSYGLVCLWDVHVPQQPLRILAAAEQPTCCCFGPVKATLVFGGMQDGSLEVWDLRKSVHVSSRSTHHQVAVQFPAYSTAAVLHGEGHGSAITALLPVSSHVGKPSAAAASLDREAGPGLSFQLASLEQCGTVNIWVVAEVSQDASAHGSTHNDSSTSDFGLAPGGQIKLLKSSAIKLGGEPSSMTPRNSTVAATATPLRATAMQLDSANAGRFFVGTDMGLVLHGMRFGGEVKGSSQMWQAYCALSVTDDTHRCSAQVTTMDASPFLPSDVGGLSTKSLLGVGCGDGSLRLHAPLRALPLVTLPPAGNSAAAAVRCVLWSRGNPNVLLALDDSSVMQTWDLSHSDAVPVKSDVVSNDSKRATMFVLSEAEKANARSKMALCFEGGAVEVHILAPHVSRAKPGDLEQFLKYVDNL